VHAQKAEADRAVADAQQELKSLQKQLAAVQSEGEVRVAAATCKRFDSKRRTRRNLSVSLRLNFATQRLRLEASSQEHTIDRSFLQEELRRVSSQSSQMKDQMSALKVEHERSVGSLQSSVSDLTMQKVKLETDARSSSLNFQEALRREKSSLASLGMENERLRLEIGKHDEERSKLIAVGDAARRQNLTLESCVNDLRRRVAALKLSGDESRSQASLRRPLVLLTNNSRNGAILERDNQQLTAQLRMSEEEHARQLRDMTSTLEEQKRRANAESARCKSLEEDARQAQLRIEHLIHDHAHESVSIQGECSLQDAVADAGSAGQTATQSLCCKCND